jgi:hypothetical protein
MNACDWRFAPPFQHPFEGGVGAGLLVPAWLCSIICTDVPQYSARPFRLAPSESAHAMNVCRVM